MGLYGVDDAVGGANKYRVALEPALRPVSNDFGQVSSAFLCCVTHNDLSHTQRHTVVSFSPAVRGHWRALDNEMLFATHICRKARVKVCQRSDLDVSKRMKKLR